jgi:hypothetical protein
MSFYKKYSDERIVVSNERTFISLDEITVGDYLIRNDNGDDGGQMFICSWIPVISKNSKGVTIQYECNGKTKKMILKWNYEYDSLQSKSHRKYFKQYVKKEDMDASDISIRPCNYWF